MRILINLRAAKNQGYESLYHHKLQGFVYGLLRDSGFGGLHDKEGYKFFCFSNIFPIKDIMGAGEAFNLIIASPNAALISSVERALEKIFGDAEAKGRDANVNVNIGEMSFKVVGFKQLSENLIKKFNDFYGTKLKECELFEQFVFRRATATKVVIEGREYVLVGSMWEFVWSYMDEMQRRIIEFGLDAGFGERNSLGFGFVNKISF